MVVVAFKGGNGHPRNGGNEYTKRNVKLGYGVNGPRLSDHLWARYGVLLCSLQKQSHRGGTTHAESNALALRALCGGWGQQAHQSHKLMRVTDVPHICWCDRCGVELQADVSV